MPSNSAATQTIGVYYTPSALGSFTIAIAFTQIEEATSGSTLTIYADDYNRVYTL